MSCHSDEFLDARISRLPHIGAMVAEWLCLPCCGPEAFGERHVLALMAFLCTFNLYLSRFNLR